MGNPIFHFDDGAAKRIRNLNRKLISGFDRRRKLFFAAGDVSESFVEPTDGLIARWTFNDSNLIDDIGSYDLSYTGSIGYGDGILGKALQWLLASATTFSTNYALGAYFRNRNPWSVSCWANTPNAMEIFKVSSTSTEIGGSMPSIFIDSSECKARIGLSAYDVIGPGIPLNVWNHICATYDGTNLSLYINLEKSTGVNTQTYSDSYRTYWKLVGSVYPSGFGLLDQARIYNRCLTDEEVAMLYKEQGLWKRVNL